MKSQDLLVALALVIEPGAKLAAIAHRTGISVSEVHAAIRRLILSELLNDNRELSRRSLLEFLTIGIRYTFPARLGGLSLGVPTGATAPMLVGVMPARDVALVWPSPHGELRGESVEPLFPTVPDVALRDRKMYELLALVDTIRTGRARERALASNQLQEILLGRAHLPGTSLASAHALGLIFQVVAVSRTIRKMRNEPRYRAVLEVPLLRQILGQYGELIADDLSRRVTDGSFSPQAAVVIDGEKPTGGARSLVFPTIADSVVARRLVDELEPVVRRLDSQNVFLGRSRTSSLQPDRDYTSYFSDLLRSRRATDITPKSERYAYVFESDVREFYPSIDLGLARQTMAASSQANPEVIHLLFYLLETWRPRARYTPAHGLPLDPVDASRIVAHTVLQPIDRSLRDIPNTSYHRYVDDTVVLTDTEEKARAVQLEHGRELRAYGLLPNSTKTRVLDISHWRIRRAYDGDHDLDRIGEAGDADAFRRFFRRTSRDYASASDERIGLRHLLRRCYGMALKLSPEAAREHAAAHVCFPDLAPSVLRYLRVCGVDAASFESVMLSIADPMMPLDLRILMARSLGDAPIIDVSSKIVADRAASFIVASTSIDGGVSWVVGWMMFSIAKHSSSAAKAHGRISAWLDNTRLDPVLRFFAVYTFGTSLDPTVENAWRHGLSDDALLAMRLCDQIAAGMPSIAVLKTCLRREDFRGSTIPADCLPLIQRIFHRRDIPSINLRWLDNATNQIRRQSPSDRATERFLGRARNAALL